MSGGCAEAPADEDVLVWCDMEDDEPVEADDDEVKVANFRPRCSETMGGAVCGAGCTDSSDKDDDRPPPPGMALGGAETAEVSTLPARLPMPMVKLDLAVPPTTIPPTPQLLLRPELLLLL